MPDRGPVRVVVVCWTANCWVHAVVGKLMKSMLMNLLASLKINQLTFLSYTEVKVELLIRLSVAQNTINPALENDFLHKTNFKVELQGHIVGVLASSFL